MISKPVIGPITPWDASVGTEIQFSYSGNLPVKNKATIYNASTMAVVYQQINYTTSFTHRIAPGVLKANPGDPNGNGNKYCIQIQTYDSDDNESYISDKVYFLCFSTPLFFYSTPEPDASLNSATVKFTLEYDQAEGEKLHSYRHYLYDNGKNLVSSTETFYTDEQFDYDFKGLANRTAYYIRTDGTTRNGIYMDTGLVRVFTNYYEPDDYEILSLSSDLNATVTGLTNMICIEADEDDDDYVYINSCVQLIDKKIHYQTNYTIQRDFSMQIKITKVLNDCILITMYNKKNKNAYITIDSYVFDDGLRYCLKVDNGIAKYVLYTDPLVDIANDDFVVLNLRRIRNIYSFEALKVED